MKQKLLFPLLLSALIAALLFSGCSDAQVQYSPNSFIKDWLILGPFPNCEGCSTTDYFHDERCTGFYTDYLQSIGGEKNAVPTEGLVVEVLEKKIENAWETFHSTEDKIQLSELMKPKDMVIAYAFSRIVSPKAQKAILSVGSNDGIRVFLNGKEVHESHDYIGRWLQIDDDYIPVELKKGTNNLMLKIDQGTGAYGFVARFLDYDSVVTKIRNDLDSYKTLKVVEIADTLVVSFGSAYKISVLNPAGKVKLELVHETKGKLAEQMAAPGEDAKFLLAGAPDGFLNIKASYPTPNDGIILSEKKYYKGKLERHPLVQRVNKDLAIIDEHGKPIFPIGTYGAPVEDYKILKDAGYNFVVASADDLDKVSDAGLLAAVPIHGKTAQEYYDQISKHKNHPAVLCWMLYDEPGYNKADLQFIYDIYNAAYKADKVHPSYLVITNSSVYRTFGPLCDVLAIDTYPIVNGDIAAVGENISLAYNQLENEVPIWHCGQMFSWPNQRMPNPQEHRFMTYAALMSGSKGALWYTYKGYGQYLPVDGPELWEAHKTLLSEMNELSSLFLEPGFGREIKLVKENKSIYGIVKESSIGTYLIAANISKAETFQSELRVNNKYNGNITVYNENRTVQINDGILQDEFKPLDIHIYKLK